MKIEVSGSRCITCNKYHQYYEFNSRGEFEAIDCGYCHNNHRTTRPGNRCKEYFEQGNVGEGRYPKWMKRV